MDFNASMLFGQGIGEQLTLRDRRGIYTRFTICAADNGRWERELKFQRTCHMVLAAGGQDEKGSTDGAPVFKEVEGMDEVEGNFL